MKLGGLMHLPKITRTNRHQQMWVLSKVDEKASAIIVDGRRDTPFDDKDVERVLGVPGEGATINNNPAPHVLSSVRQTLGISSSETRISVIEEIVKKEYGRAMTKSESDAFKVAYVVCAVTYVLAPPLKHNYFLTEYWGGLHTPDLIHMYNWGKYVREEVLLSAGRVKSKLLGGKVKSNISGCTFFIQVFYLDNLDLEDENLPHDVFPRCKVYDQKKISMVIEKDTSAGKNADIVIYGLLLPRPAHTVCYSRNRASMSFIGKIADIGAGSSRYQRAPMIEEIVTILVEKVGQYSSRCRAALQAASKKGAKINKKHADGWDGVVRETDIFIEEETSKMLADIDEISETVRQNNKRPREQDYQDDDVSPEESGEESPFSPRSAICPVNTDKRNVDDGNPIHRSNDSQRGGSPKRARVEETEEDPDPAIKNLEGLVAAADQDNEVTNDTVVHEQMPIQAKAADGRQWVYGPNAALNTEVPSYDLGIDNAGPVLSPGRELSVVAKTQQPFHIQHHTAQAGPSRFKIDFTGFRSKDLMDDFSRAVTPEVAGTSSVPSANTTPVSTYGKNELQGSGLDIICTPVHRAIEPNKAAGTTPVSLNREIAAQELDVREEMEEAAINLNVPQTQDGLSTHPQRKRTVKPGKAARSPFVLGYDPPLRAPANVEKVFKMFMKEPASARKDNWVISTQPKYIELSAERIRTNLSEGGVIDNDLMTIAVRRYQQIDYTFALDKDEGCWRHWLEPDFVNHVSRGDVIVRYVQDMFIGEHIKYDVHRCTEFLLNVKFNFTWSTYIWDFVKRRIIVLDPTINNGDESDKVIQSRHRKVADNLHEALQRCIQAFFQGWAPDMTRWNTVFPKGINVGLCSGPDSGVYALHYGRNWMGSKFKRDLNPQHDGVLHSRMNILVDVLGLEGNIGHLPERYKKCLVRNKEDA
ncbi:uncharacterized protein [Triticum aestivum]|uniref:uncharacterized protein isoform X3 n=1 Tax=Triticum aestivum TaxID=4565 RepID=UPI001D015731|nr:uncharacterized protein LOC123149198 isoform X3 [Triticum aestivum]